VASPMSTRLFPLHQSRRTFLASMLSVTIAACGGGEPGDLALAPVPGDFYGEWPIQAYVARSRSEWAQIWASHKSYAFPAPTMPEVDFDAYSVVGVAMGWRPSGCNGMQIVSATESSSEVVVQYRELEPPSGVGCTGAFVFLVQFATIPKTSKPVNFLQIP
jgi:hypothetical protein